MAEINVSGYRAPEVGVSLGATPAPPDTSTGRMLEAVVLGGKEIYDTYQSEELQKGLVKEQDTFSQLLDRTAGDPDKKISIEQAINDDPEVKNLLSKANVYRQAEEQGVTPRYLLELKTEAALKDSIRRAPWAANRLRQVAANVLGFDPSGMAFRKLLAPLEKGEPTEAEQATDLRFKQSVQFLQNQGLDVYMLNRYTDKQTGVVDKEGFIESAAQAQQAVRGKRDAEEELDAATKEATLIKTKAETQGIVDKARQDAADRRAAAAARRMAENEAYLADFEISPLIESGVIQLATQPETLTSAAQQEDFKQAAISSVTTQKNKINRRFSQLKAQYPDQAAVFDERQKSINAQLDSTLESLKDLGQAEKWAKLAKAMSDRTDSQIGADEAYKQLLIYQKIYGAETLATLAASNAVASGKIDQVLGRYVDLGETAVRNAAARLSKSDFDNLAQMTLNPDSVMLRSQKDQQLYVEGMWPTIKSGMKIPVGQVQPKDVDTLMNNFATVLSLRPTNQEEVAKFIATQAWKPYLDKFKASDSIKADVVGATLRSTTSKYLLSEGGMKGGTDQLISLLSSGVKMEYDAGVGQFRVVELPKGDTARGGAILPARAVQEQVSTINNLLKANDALAGYADAGAVTGAQLGNLMVLQMQGTGTTNNLKVIGKIPEMDAEAAKESAIEGVSVAKAEELKTTRSQLQELTKKLIQLSGQNVVERFETSRNSDVDSEIMALLRARPGLTYAEAEAAVRGSNGR